MDETISLPERFDSTSAQTVAAALYERLTQEVTLDGAGVAAAGALGVQVLVACRKQWQADGAPFCVRAPSEALLDACRLLGVAPTEIGAGAGTEGAA